MKIWSLQQNSWMDMEGIMASETNQKKTNVWFHLYVESKNTTN